MEEKKEKKERGKKETLFTSGGVVKYMAERTVEDKSAVGNKAATLRGGKRIGAWRRK